MEEMGKPGLKQESLACKVDCMTPAGTWLLPGRDWMVCLISTILGWP